MLFPDEPYSSVHPDIIGVYPSGGKLSQGTILRSRSDVGFGSGRVMVYMLASPLIGAPISTSFELEL
ncbi:hypothetical protein TNCT_91041 [Trichonephila clavata]|uniref:Uncharacterized protein n=1 Tax=Trichonephila clavata TaxID=2740835 RepID=A0A8X6FP04_TRICU|nr:hypothetical protein TNCT_91041 [Trichonephila clavata]